jgi:hypothetical protein
VSLRILAFSLSFCCLEFVYFAQPAAAQSDCPDVVAELSLSGRVGGVDVQAFLASGHPADTPDGVFGAFFYPAQWTPLTGPKAAFGIDGTVNGCEVRLMDSQGGEWRLRFAAKERLEGTREFPKGTVAVVNLRVVTETDCSGRGAWRTFTSPNWPITFAHPASWRLGANDTDIVVQCPSAKRMSFGGDEIWFQRGQERRRFETEDGRPATEIGAAFVTFGDGPWRLGPVCEFRPADEPSFGCVVARRSEWRGMTVLQGSAGEHRLYRIDGGYIGQGGGITSYLFLLAGEWVLIHSHDGTVPPEKLGTAGGPVQFGGDDVTARLVRSIRPK